MSNLQSAKSAIEAELSNAKAGKAYYESRVEALEETLVRLASLNQSGDTPADAPIDTQAKSPKKAKSRLPAASTDERPKRQKKQGGKESASTSDLPFTGGDYWPNLLTAEPKSSPEVLKAAIDKLEFTPNKTQIKKLAGRMTFALNTLVKTKKIQDSGSGRERRFFI